MINRGRKEKVPVSLCLVLVFILNCAAVHAAKVESYSDLTFSEELQWPKTHIEEFSLENGVQCFLVEDHEFPLIKVKVQLRTGSVLEPEGKEGLVDLLADVMREGGTADFPGKRLNRFLENRAAKLEIGIDRTSGQASLDVLKKDFPSTLGVFASLLQNPSFPADKLALAKRRMMTKISRRNDDQDQVGFREFKKIIYGAKSKPARVPEYESVAAVTLEDLIQFHSETFCGANLQIGVVGDFSPKEMKRVLRDHFSVFPAGSKTVFSIEQNTNRQGQKWYLAPMSEVEQTFVLMGYQGGYRQNPEYAALQVLNNILGGGFSGRLMQEIRTKQGLAYSVFGRYGCKFFYPGMFFVGLKTKTRSTLQAITSVKETLARLKNQGVRAEEVAKAKDRFLNSLVFRYDSPEEVLDRRMYYEYRDMPPDSFQQLIREIKAVHRQDVQRVAEQYLHPDELRILLVGNEQELADQITGVKGLQRITLSKQ